VASRSPSIAKLYGAFATEEIRKRFGGIVFIVILQKPKMVDD
jgi:hypothetical protein